jgi:hypothetical protein
MPSAISRVIQFTALSTTENLFAVGIRKICVFDAVTINCGYT